MKITFYGTRGSIPVCEKDRVHVGGNTACVLLTFADERVTILDAGTGIRKLGNDLMAKNHEQYDNIFVAFSHTHLDHIQGFPFFKPAYDPRRHFTLAIMKQENEHSDLESVLTGQMRNDYFPIPMQKMGAQFSFWEPVNGEFTSKTGVTVIAQRHNHPGGAFSYRFEENGKSVVYCSDVEHGKDLDPNIIELARGADILIHDAQYTPEELSQKAGWGHSSYEQAAEVARLAAVNTLVLFHHDPEHTDKILLHMENDCQKLFPNTCLAIEGKEMMA